FGLSSTDRVFQFASFSFDTSAEQILPTLGVGAAIVLPPPGLISPEMMNDSVQQHGVTVLNLPPAFFRLWSASRGGKCLPLLRLIILGGEALVPELLTVRSKWPK